MNYTHVDRTRDYTKPALGLCFIQLRENTENEPICVCTASAHLSGADFESKLKFFALLCDGNLFIEAAFVKSENKASCSHKTLTWGWRKRLWEGHGLPLFGLQ